MKKNKLRVDDIEELSLVDSMANQHSHAVFHKRNARGESTVKTKKGWKARLATFLKGGADAGEENGIDEFSKALSVSLQSTRDDPNMTDDEKEEAIEKTLGDFALAVLSKKKDESDDEGDDDEDESDDENGDDSLNDGEDDDAVDKSKAKKDSADCNTSMQKRKDTQVKKSAEVIRLEKRAENAEKVNKALAARVEAIEKANVRKALVKKAGEMLGDVEYEGGADALADVLDNMDEKQIKNMEKMFKKQNALIEASPLLEVFGSDDEGSEEYGTDAVEKTNARADAIRKSAPTVDAKGQPIKKMTDEQAQVQAMLEGGDSLYFALERETALTR